MTVSQLSESMVVVDCRERRGFKPMNAASRSSAVAPTTTMTRLRVATSYNHPTQS
jgi:hypothetical protein